jgi:hypothetical protein
MTSPSSSIDAWAWFWTRREDRAVLAFRLGIVSLMAPLAIDMATRLHPAALRLVASTSAPEALATLADSLVAGGLFFFLGRAAWTVTARVEWGPPAWTPLLLLTLQVVAGALGSPELLVVACLQAPFVLQGRALGIFVAATAVASVIAGPAGTRRAGGLAAVGLAAALGSAVAGSVRAWRELVRGEAELRASRRLLEGHACVGDEAAVQDARVGRTIAAIAKDLARVRWVSPGEPDDPLSGALALVDGLHAAAPDATAAPVPDPGLELRHALAELATSNGVEIRIDVSDPLGLSPAGADAVLECARLALVAVAQAGEHPKCTIEVVPMGAGHLVTVSVDPLPADGIGEADLRAVRDRVRAVGGALQAGRVEDGYSLRALIPDTPRS